MYFSLITKITIRIFRLLHNHHMSDNKIRVISVPSKKLYCRNSKISKQILQRLNDSKIENFITNFQNLSFNLLLNFGLIPF